MSAWASGAAYEPYVGRWSRMVARVFVDWLGAASGAQWLDAGCGTGALTDSIFSAASPGRVRSVDASSAYLHHAREHSKALPLELVVGDAQHLPFAGASFDVVVSGLMLNFLPAPEQGVVEMARVARRDGVVAAYVWDYAGQMQLMRLFWDAAAELDAVAHDLDEGRRFPGCRPEPLAALFRGADLKAVEVRAIDVPTVFRDFDDYWLPFLGGQGPAPGYAASLSETRRMALRELVRSRLPVAVDGSIALTARAWAVRGTVDGT